VLVTHDQGEALSLADQVAVMVQGRFLQVSPPAEVYLRPASPTVAGFVGHATLLPGVASGARASCALGSLPLLGDHHGPVLVVVRPEQVSVATGAEGVPAEVIDVSFFGHDATVRARVRDTETVVIARVPAGGVPEPGAVVCLGVAGQVLAFPEAGER
jgi:iron(III) transport system ATP-binding protein